MCSLAGARVFAISEKCWREHRIGPADHHAIGKMIQVADTPCDDRMSSAEENARVSSRSKPLRVPSRSMLSAGFHRRRALHFLPHSSASRPWPCARRGLDLPAQRIGSGNALGVDGNDDALRA